MADAAVATSDASPEDLVFDRLRSALPAAVRLYRNVRWIAAPGDGGPNADGETDVLVVDPARGLLVIEVKGGTVRVDGHGRWYAGRRLLQMSPFEQAERGKHRLVRLLAEDPDWLGDPPAAGHAAAFPDVDWATAGPGVRDLGADAPRAICLDAEDLASDASAAAAVERAWRFWLGAAGGRPIPARSLDVIARAVVRPVELRPILRRAVERGEGDVRAMTAHQARVLEGLCAGNRRASVSGGAGTGKTQLAMERARRLARDGFRTLLVCFNQPLARAFRNDPALAELIAAGSLEAHTFHDLARRLEETAGILPPGPGAPGGADDLPAWFDAIAGRFLEAVERVPDRFHAIVVDEGQDFARDWLESLPFLLDDPESDVLYVFHDPGQSLYRTDEVAALGLTPYVLQEDCRNAGDIHDLAERFAGRATGSVALRELPGGVEVVAAEPGAETVDAVRRALHRVVDEGRVPPWDVVVLVGMALHRSDVWKARRFGNQVLWNGSVDDAGRQLGLPAEAVPEQPPDTVLCETIHRFKGLDEKVAILADLRPDDPRLEQLLYVGITRARDHLVLVAPPAVARRLA
jgi:hypothetical protein